MLHVLVRLGILHWFTNICLSSLTILIWAVEGKGTSIIFQNAGDSQWSKCRCVQKAKPKCAGWTPACCHGWINLLYLFFFAYPALIADGTIWYVDFRVLSLLKSKAQGLRTNVYLGVLFGTWCYVISITTSKGFHFCWSLVAVFSVFIHTSPVSSSQCAHQTSCRFYLMWAKHMWTWVVVLFD